MTAERWTGADCGRRHKPAEPEPVRTVDDNLMTLAMLLTGTGPPMPDSDVRALESFLDDL